MSGWRRIQRSRAAISAGSCTRNTSDFEPGRAGTCASVSKSAQTSLSKAAPSDSKTPTIRSCRAPVLEDAAELEAADPVQDPATHHHLVEARREEPAGDEAGSPSAPANACGVTGRSTTLVRRPSDLRGSAMTETHSQETSGRPSGPRTAGTWSRIALRSSSSTREVTSELEPRLTTMALSGRPVPRSAAAKPLRHGHQHGEDRHHERDADDGQQRHRPPRADAADVVDERQRHGYGFLSISVTRAR